MSDALDSHEEMLDLVALYALGSLGRAEAATVQGHLAECARCHAEYAMLRPTVDALALAEEAELDARTSARMKRRLKEAISPRTVTRRATIASIVAVAAVLVAMWLGATTVMLRGQLAAMRANEAKLTSELADIAAPDARRYAIAGGAIVRRGAHLYVVLNELGPPPPGRVYQLWTLARGAKAMTPSITLTTTGGSVVVGIPGAGPEVTAVAMSIEPPGGSAQPTTKPLFVRKLE
jgi:anti-sigma factor RsiW